LILLCKFKIAAQTSERTRDLFFSQMLRDNTRRITPKRVTSWRCPSPRHSAKGNTARGKRVNRSAIEAVKQN